MNKYTDYASIDVIGRLVTTIDVLETVERLVCGLKFATDSEMRKYQRVDEKVAEQWSKAAQPLRYADDELDHALTYLRTAAQVLDEQV